MQQNEMIKKLSSLVHLDIDATHAYDQAIENIDTPVIKQTLLGFKQDHVRHIENIGRIISQLGGSVPEKRDFKGYMIEGFTALRSKMGTEQALRAMKTNEKLTNSTYGEALTWPVSEEVRSVIRANAEDERRHLAYIEQVLRERSWESRAA